MENVLSSVASSMKGQTGGPALLAGTGSDQKQLVIVATSERGLCGGFNTNIVKAAKAKIKALIEDGKEVTIITIGKKGASVLKREYEDKMVQHFDMSHVKNLAFDDASPIASRLIEMYEAGDYDEILEDLLPRNVGVQLFRALLENAASEQGSRMTAMDNATRNAGEMIDDLRTTYNRSRQAVITNELIEIISGAEAL
jgi:F-type H+-transporting ATPase subunit gamma